MDRRQGPYQEEEEAWVSVELESTEQDVVDEVRVAVVVLLVTVLCAALLEHMSVTGNMYIEPQNDDTFLATVTVTDTTCSRCVSFIS